METLELVLLNIEKARAIPFECLHGLDHCVTPMKMQCAVVAMSASKISSSQI